MFLIDKKYFDINKVSCVKVDAKTFTATVNFDGSVKDKVTFEDKSSFDTFLENFADFISLAESLYNPRRIPLVIPKNLSMKYVFDGGMVINYGYPNSGALTDAIADLKATHIDLNGKYYLGTRVEIIKKNDSAKTLRFRFNNTEELNVTYETEEEYLAAIDFVENIGAGTGDSGTKTATPAFTVNPGPVTSGTTFKITCATEGATIHYTTDGTTPTLSSPTYDDSDITVPDEGITVKAIAVLLGLATSNVATGEFTVPTYESPYYKGWFLGDTDPLPTLTANDLEGLAGLEMGEATSANSPDPNIYTAPTGIEEQSGRIVWAYPASLGDCEYFTDGFGKHAIADSYTKQVLDVDGTDYNVYVLTTPIAPNEGDEYPVVFSEE